MADDLDDFFDEIEEAVAEVTEKGEAAVPETTTAGSTVITTDGQSKPTEKDIVDAKPTEDSAEPPAKRIKVAVASAPARPKGAVVAASAASSSTTVAKKAQQPQQPIAPPPPPPIQHSSSNNDRYFGPGSKTSTNLPPLPSMPPLPPGPPPPPSTSTTKNSNKPVVRMAAGKSWVDNTLSDWPENDFRIFVGNLGAEVDDPALLQHFQTKYASATMSKIVRDATGKTKGYGFVSFLQPLDCAKAIREQDQAWLGSRPIRVKRSDWQERNKSTVKKKHRNERKQQKKRGGGRLYY
eukprot:CAMPEP_0116077644 /NCGR_PEP_ID=MMETSP0327-20121206/174_1 /TAXON_ID=44447 /ORGANISM="Pseudo-nitzschia delicatissima, Strain B596" /LENGTH=293 /DNA_ID=CAMNT_0003568127 /DNA_START=58 /DNA_END=939 /DNA_ORIENTATION=+